MLTHVLAIKACALILYPSYFEYISFCQGFMVIDFPWINDFFANMFTNMSDNINVPFALFYSNMGIFGTFLLGLIAYLLLYLIGKAYFSGS